MACGLYPKILAGCHRLPNECGNENLRKKRRQDHGDRSPADEHYSFTCGANSLPIETAADRQADEVQIHVVDGAGRDPFAR